MRYNDLYRRRSATVPPWVTWTMVTLVTCAAGCHATSNAGSSVRSSPLRVARGFNAALKAGDVPRAMSLAHTTTEADRQAVRLLVDSTEAEQKIRRAIADRFGPDAEFEIGSGLRHNEEFDDAAVRIDADSALVIVGPWKDAKNLGDQQDVADGVYRLVRRRGGWLVAVRAKGERAESPETSAAVRRAISRTADEIAAEVRAGKYENPQEAAGAHFERLVQAVAAAAPVPEDEPEDKAEDVGAGEETNR